MSKQISVAVLGCGGVGQCIAQDLAKSNLVSKLLLADINLKGAESVKQRTGSDKIEIRKTDASSPKEVAKIAKQVDILVNGVAPVFNLRILEGCLKGGSNYIDMASTWEYLGIPSSYKSYDEEPELESLGNHMEIQSEIWKAAGQLALIDMGIEPGASDLFAKRAADRMESVDYVKIRDGDNGVLEGYEFATLFSPEAMLEEVLVDPIYWENGKWRRSRALEVSEIYDFPPPVGRLKVYRTEHEETELIPLFLGKPVKKVDFMIGIDEKFINYVSMLKKLGLTKSEPIDVKGVKVAPLDVIVATMPRPDSIGSTLRGTTIALAEVGGKMKGKNVVIKTWIGVTHEESYRLTGHNATSYTTAMPLAVVVEMFARGEIKATGVRAPEEAVDPVKFCEHLTAKGIPVHENITPL